MNTKDELILAAKMAVKTAERRVSRGEWKPEKILEAKSKLNDLINGVVKPHATIPPLPKNEVIEVKRDFERVPPQSKITLDLTASDLVKEAQAASRLLAELSNQIHCTEDNVAKINLLRRVGIAQAKKERKWTEYYHYKRNGELLVTKYTGPVIPEVNPELLAKEKIFKGLSEKLSRLKGRLDGEPLSESKRIELEELYNKTYMEHAAAHEEVKFLREHGKAKMDST